MTVWAMLIVEWVYHRVQSLHDNEGLFEDCEQCVRATSSKDFWLQVGVNFFEVGVCFVPSTGTTSESFCITVSVWYHGRIYVRLN